MTTATAHERHRAHHTRMVGLRETALPWLLTLFPPGLVVLLTGACGSSLPRPPSAPVTIADYVEVPVAPATPPVEYVPSSPHKDAVWVDGTWEWARGRYAWRFGTWLVPPPGARYARWVIVRRAEDGKLFFARSSWKDEAGNVIDDRAFARGLGPRARARSRPGAGEPAAGPERVVVEEQLPDPLPSTGDAEREKRPPSPPRPETRGGEPRLRAPGPSEPRDGTTEESEPRGDGEGGDEGGDSQR